jgi:MFS family permease
MEEADEARPSKRSEIGLDWLNFFIADVQAGFGPFVALYLASLNWSQGQIGLLLTVSTLSSIASQAPGGALVDAAPSKRLLIGGALAAIATAALIFAFFPNPVIIFIAVVLYGSTDGVIKPALSAIGLGLVGHSAFSGRVGRNQRYNSLGMPQPPSSWVLSHILQDREPLFSSQPAFASRLPAPWLAFTAAKSIMPAPDRQGFAKGRAKQRGYENSSRAGRCSYLSSSSCCFSSPMPR